MLRFFTSIFLMLSLLQPAYAAKTFITIGSGSTTGIYYTVAIGMAKLINNAPNQLRANARSTGASVYNILALEQDQLQLAIVQNDIAYYAAQGKVVESFHNNPAKKLRGIATLYPEYVHILASAKENIQSIADLKGKRVYVGDVGSGAEQSTLQILSMYGLTFNDIYPVRGSASLGAQLLQDGRIAAMFYTAGLGSAAIQQVAQTTPIKFLSLDSEYVEKLKQNYPFYISDTIPANIYKGQKDPVPALAVKAMLVASSELPSQTIKDIIHALFSNVNQFKKIHADLQHSFKPELILDGMSIELADGALEAFHELGLLQEQDASAAQSFSPTEDSIEPNSTPVNSIG